MSICISAWDISASSRRIFMKLDIRGFFKSVLRNLMWCGFDSASSLICGNKMPTRCNRGFYCRFYCLLNMFRAPLCPSSGAQEYYTVVAVCGISCCGLQVVGLVWSWGLCVRFAQQDAALAASCWASNKICKKKRPCVEKIQVSLKSDKDNRYFTCRSKYLYDNTSLSAS